MKMYLEAYSPRGMYIQLEHEQRENAPRAFIRPRDQVPLPEVYDRIPLICKQLAITTWEILHNARDLHINVGMYRSVAKRCPYLCQVHHYFFLRPLQNICQEVDAPALDALLPEQPRVHANLLQAWITWPTY
jgi:hypothetical protein